MYDGPKISLFSKQGGLEGLEVSENIASHPVPIIFSFAPFLTPICHLSDPLCLYGYVRKLVNHFVSSKKLSSTC